MPFKYFEAAPSFDASKVFYVRVDPDISQVQELLSHLYYTLWFPGYFGFNWDALHDCLCDLSWMPCRKVVLVHSRLPGIPAKDLKTYLEILRDAASDWRVPGAAHELDVFFKNEDREAIERILKERV
ncbi:MAG TPA: barstar family protein [Stenotrophomonas sp.]|nr:barstar family protein [Stenotrophomonas sp.]